MITLYNTCLHNSVSDVNTVQVLLIVLYNYSIIRTSFIRLLFVRTATEPLVFSYTCFWFWLFLWSYKDSCTSVLQEITVNTKRWYHEIATFSLKLRTFRVHIFKEFEESKYSTSKPPHLLHNVIQYISTRNSCMYRLFFPFSRTERRILFLVWLLVLIIDSHVQWMYGAFWWIRGVRNTGIKKYVLYIITESFVKHWLSFRMPYLLV